MAMGSRVRLVLVDGTEVETTYDGRDIRAWEGKYGTTAIGIKSTLSLLTFCGWSAAKRDGSLNGEYDSYEAFDAVCVGMVPPHQEPETQEPPDPTEPSTDTPSEVSDG